MALTSSITGWSSGALEQESFSVPTWDSLVPSLTSEPHTRRIALRTRDHFRHVSPCLKELIIIKGSEQLLDPPDPLLLFGLENLASWSIPQVGHDPPIELVGYTQGITPSIDGQRTIAILFSWVDEARRSRFIDPEQESYGVYGADEYEQQVASKIRDFEGRGATVESHLWHMQVWSPPVERKKRKQGCVMM